MSSFDNLHRDRQGHNLKIPGYHLAYDSEFHWDRRESVFLIKCPGDPYAFREPLSLSEKAQTIWYFKLDNRKMLKDHFSFSLHNFTSRWEPLNERMLGLAQLAPFNHYFEQFICSTGFQKLSSPEENLKWEIIFFPSKLETWPQCDTPNISASSPTFVNSALEHNLKDKLQETQHQQRMKNTYYSLNSPSILKLSEVIRNSLCQSFLKFEHEIFVCFCKDNCVYVSIKNNCVSNEETGGSATASAIYFELHPKSKMDQQMNRQLWDEASIVMAELR